jgi:hypothetical protein
MKELLKRWWEGTYVPPPPDYPNSRFVFISPGTYKHHWTAKAAHVAKNFWMKHWQWCFSATFATVGLVIAAMKL